VKRGTLVAFEGIDGSGKTTLLANVAAALRGAGRDVVETREPTDGPHGRRIREAARANTSVDPEEELAWFVADRREHVERVIAPALDAGRVVLTDRYFLSSVAYQGARGLDSQEILRQSESEFPLPDLALLLELSPERALERIANRGHAAEPLFEEREFLTRVAAEFERLARPYLYRLDATLSPQALLSGTLLLAVALRDDS